MKKQLLRITLITCLLVTSLFFGGAAFAQDEELPDPGITPDSPFYLFDKLGKNIGMFFAFGAEAKTRKALQYAEERLAEARTMAAKNRVREMERAANDYDGFMAMVTNRLEEARQQGTSANISERVALATAKHLAVLDRVGDQLPEQAREALTRARTATMNGQVNALRTLAKNKPERAIDINLDAIEKRLERARLKAAEEATAEVDEALEDAAKLEEIEEEITEIAEEAGIDIAAIRERIAHAVSNRLEVLTGVYEKAPETARPALEKAMQNSVRKYERAVEKLRERNALAEAAELEKEQEQLRERIRLATTAREQISNDVSGNVSVEVRAESGAKAQNRERLSNTEQQRTETVSANQTRERK